ncbi:NUDIX domain-containing protein [Streptomyces sp. NPDC048473]|uniref:NUDIX domain-containing protein n=1 Tax=unclassified Streptomyces TaxID=2593676 RepID=UPI00371D0649
MTTTGAVPAIAIRTCAAIIESDEICLIRRARPDGDQYSLPGGLLHPEEEVPVALARELKEELDLDVTALPDRPRLRWAQDQITTRPGRTGTFRRLHLIHLLAIPRYVRAVLPATEQDAEDITSVVWVPLAQAAERHLYPAVGNALSQLTEPADAPSNVLLPPITDQTYTWR